MLLSIVFSGMVNVINFFWPLRPMALIWQRLLRSVFVAILLFTNLADLSGVFPSLSLFNHAIGGNGHICM